MIKLFVYNIILCFASGFSIYYGLKFGEYVENFIKKRNAKINSRMQRKLQKLKTMDNNQAIDQLYNYK